MRRSEGRAEQAKASALSQIKINMQYKIYTIPVIEGESETEGLNKLLRANKIVKVDKERRKA